MNYRTNASLLQNTNQTSCWFVSGQAGHVVVGVRLEFKNGQTLTVAEKGDFTLFRPTIWLEPLSSAEGDHYYTISSRTPLSCKLKLGEPDESNEGTMQYTVNVRSTYGGWVGITQLITADYINPIYIFSDERCDGPEFYSGTNRVYGRLPTVSGSTYLDDGPWSLWAAPNMVGLSSRDFVRFQPDGGIFVTLGIVTWETYGIANTLFWPDVDDTWYIQDQGTSGPSGPDSSDEFPVWRINQGGMH